MRTTLLILGIITVFLFLAGCADMASITGPGKKPVDGEKSVWCFQPENLSVGGDIKAAVAALDNPAGVYWLSVTVDWPKPRKEVIFELLYSDSSKAPFELSNLPPTKEDGNTVVYRLGLVQVEEDQMVQLISKHSHGKTVQVLEVCGEPDN